MKLYSLEEAATVTDGEQTFEADEDGGFELSHDVATRLHGIHIDGKRVWETEGERQERLISEEDKRRRDPATLLEAVQALTEKLAGGSADDAAKAEAEAEEAKAKAEAEAKAKAEAKAAEAAAKKAAAAAAPTK